MNEITVLLADIPPGTPPSEAPQEVEPVQSQPAAVPTAGGDQGVPAAALAVIAVVVVALIALALVLLVRHQGREHPAT